LHDEIGDSLVGGRLGVGHGLEFGMSAAVGAIQSWLCGQTWMVTCERELV
jgi:hypothetical protein